MNAINVFDYIFVTCINIFYITGYPPPPAYQEQNKGVSSAYPPPGTGYPSQGYVQPGYGQTGYTHQSTTAVVRTYNTISVDVIFLQSKTEWDLIATYVAELKYMRKLRNKLQ
jgi:hypothetical protein